MPDVSFDPKSVAIAVITYYPKWYRGKLRSIKHSDKVRGDLALEFFQEASTRGYVVVCSDGKSSQSFQKELHSLASVIVIKRRTVGSGKSKREVLRKITKIDGIKAIVLTEAEKVSIITDCLPALVKPILENKAEIVVPQREDVLFKSTYPDYMYASEVEGNRIYNEALRTNGIIKSGKQDFDFFFGPRVFKNDKKIVSLFMKRYQFTGKSIVSNLYDPDAYSNILFFPLINALRKNMQVVGIEVPFRYPVIQKENEALGDREVFILKRRFQRVNLLTDLMHFLSFIQSHQRSRLKAL